MTEATIERTKEKPSRKREQMYEGQKEGANLDAWELRGGDCDWHQQGPGENNIKLDRTGWQGPNLVLRPRQTPFILKTMGGH